MKILLLGGTGLIGTALARKLCQKGHTCSIPSRQSLLSKKATQGIRYIEFSFDSIPKLLSNHDIVINLIGENIMGLNLTKKKKQRLVSSRVSIAEHISSCLRKMKQPTKLWINASAIGFYDEYSRDVVDENSAAGTGFMSALCKAWEQPLQETDESPAKARLTRKVRLRIALVLSQEAGIFPKFVAAYKLGLGSLLGDGLQGFSWIHIDDLVAAILFIIETEAISGAVNLSSPQPLEQRVFSKTLAKLLNRPHILRIPNFLPRLLLGEMSSLLLQGVYVIPRKLTKHGFQYAYPRLIPALQNLLARRSLSKLSKAPIS